MQGSKAKLSNDYLGLLGVLFAFAAIYLCTYPEQWLINDAYSYFNRAVAFTNGCRDLLLTDAVDGSIRAISGSHYALGNAAWLALWMLVFGQNGVFLSSLFCTIAGIVITSLAIRRAGYSTLGSYWLLLLLPLQFYSRTLMACMPSFLIASIFLWMLIRSNDSGLKWFTLCALAAFSIWFRETNILLLGLICLVHFAGARKYFFYFAAGSLLGLLPRLISHHLVYGDPLQYLLSEGISLGAMVDQLGLYLFLLVGVFPGAAFFLARYRGVYQLPLQVALTATFLLYLAYDYDATQYSGFVKGALVNSRFLLPTAPFLCFMFAEWLSRYRLPSYSGILSVVTSLLVTSGSQYIIHQEQVKHSRVSHQIEAKYHDQLVLYDMSGYTNILRYINPLATDLGKQGDVKKLADPTYLEAMLAAYPEAIVVLSDNQAGVEKSQRTKEIKSYLEAAMARCQVTELESIPIEDGLSLQVFRLSKK